MKYTAKSLVERAFNLADLGNTDFISHKEATQYLNDAFTSVYNWFSNLGIKQFVKEVGLANSYSFGHYTEYEIPHDMYQAISIKDVYSGRIVPRQAESEGINSGHWEIVNDKIRLYGANSTNLVLTYYFVPPYLSYPDKIIDVQDRGDILSTASDSVLFSDGTIVNLKTQEVLGNITPSNNINVQYVLGNGHILTYNYSTNNQVAYLDFNGNVLQTVNSITNFYGIHDEHYNALYNDHGEWKLFNRVKAEDELPTSNSILIDGTIIKGSDYNATDLFPADNYNGNRAFYGNINGVAHLFVITKDGLEYDECDIESPIFMAFTKYGVLGSNGTNVVLESGIPDVDMNFTNSQYYSFVAYELALLFLAKQGAENPGLAGAYEGAKLDYKNSLDQNSSYPRIRKSRSGGGMW